MDLEYLDKYSAIIGCDEVGRGPIAGPVNSCAVKIENTQTKLIQGLIELNVTDSKKLSDKKRKKILELLEIDVQQIRLGVVYKKNFLENSYSFCVEEHSHDDIDRMNILQASLSAMKNASDKLYVENSIVLIDGNKSFISKSAVEAIVKGDSKVVAIALASIIAKVFRDEKMVCLDQKYPGYNFKKHAGYPTKEHKNAVKELGPSPIHRKTFKGVKEFLS